MSHWPIRPNYRVPVDRPSHCDKCKRSDKFFDGCSMSECPMRKPITAAPRDDPEGKTYG